MSNFELFDFDMSSFGMSDLDMASFGHSNLDILNNGIAPDAFQWANEEHPMAGYMSSAIPPMEEKSAFQADLEVIDDPSVPSASKKWMFDVLLNDVIPYRYYDHFRLFPDIGFYRTLLYNRPDCGEIWPLVERFHEWISNVAASSPDETDEAIEALKLRAAHHGWPSNLCIHSDPAREPVEGISEHIQQDLSSKPSSSVSPPSTTSSTQGKRAVSQSSKERHPLLQAELHAAPDFLYSGLIQDMDHFDELNSAYEQHLVRAAGTAPQEDASWPTSSTQQREYVQRLFESITDLSNFFELRKARERLGSITNAQQEQPAPSAVENPRKRRRGRDGQDVNVDRQERPKGMSKTDWALVDDRSTPVDLLEAVIHHRISGFEVELLCWKLLRCAMQQQEGFTMRPLWSGARTVSTWEHFQTFSERWEAICENLRDCKMIVHSLTRADWFCKYAGAPSKERGAKLSNDLLNGRRDIQNQVGRDTIKEKTSKQDWITSDDFEIRNKDGQLILKGGHLGDTKRRQLAIRKSNDL